MSLITLLKDEHKRIFRGLAYVVAGCYLTAGFFYGCSGATEEALQRKVDQDWLIMQTYTEKMVEPRLNSLIESVGEIQSQIQTHCEPDNQRALDIETLQELWVQAMYDYHYLEPLMYGPEVTFDVGATKTPLRWIYSTLPPQRAPLVIRSQISAAERQKENYNMSRPQIGALGLHALEALLFNVLPEGEPFSSGSGECYYLQYMTQDLRGRLQDFEEQWILSERNFIHSLEGKTRLREKISELASHMVLYTDHMLLGYRVKAPMGLNQKLFACDGFEECQQKFSEHPYYLKSNLAFEAPLQALYDIFQTVRDENGSPARFSFDSYFEALNVNDSYLKSNPMGKLLTLSKSLKRDTLASDDLVNAEYSVGSEEIFIFKQDLQSFLAWLKTDFLIGLNTQPPQGVQGDND
jgi:hypothetical protein